MDTQTLISLLQESLYLVVVFSLFLVLAMVRGKQTLINVILALYLALLLAVEFPYYDMLFGAIGNGQSSNAVPMLVLFGAFTLIAFLIFNRLMPRDYDDRPFQGFGKKALFALMATVLVMIYSYHVLPVTELFTPGSPVQALFGPEDRFFLWMLVPILGLLLL